MSSVHYKITIDHYAGPSAMNCYTKKDILPTIREMERKISGSSLPAIVLRVTTEDITEEILAQPDNEA